MRAAGALRPLRALLAHAYDAGAARPCGSLREPQLASLAWLGNEAASPGTRATCIDDE